MAAAQSTAVLGSLKKGLNLVVVRRYLRTFPYLTMGGSRVTCDGGVTNMVMC